jgi:hypothetical protein
MTRADGRPTAFVALVVLASVAACSFKDIDAVTSGPAVPDEAADTSAPTGTDASARESAVGVSPESGPDGSAATGLDATAPPEASLSDVTALDADAGASSALACTGAQPAVQAWTFDSSVQGWTVSADTGVDARAAWVGTTGDPSPGAIALTVTHGDASSPGAWLRYMMPLGDLSGRTVSAWVWLDSGSSPQLKLFVQSGSQYVWADSGTVTLPLRQWTCVSLDVTSPVYNGPDYDPTNIVNLGFETLAVDSFRILVDSVEYY